MLTKLEAGEVDAGVVYVTDDLASDAVEAIDIGDVVFTTAYPIVAVTDDEAAQSFVDFVTGPGGPGHPDRSRFSVAHVGFAEWHWRCSRRSTCATSGGYEALVCPAAG